MSLRIRFSFPLKLATLLLASAQLAPVILSQQTPAPSLNPSYLNGMPSVDLVKRQILGKDPTDTLARQVAVFSMLLLVTQRYLLADRHRYSPTPDEQKVNGQYVLAANELEQGYAKTHTPDEAKAFSRLRGQYELDSALFQEMFTKLFSPAFLADYRKIDSSVNKWYQAHLEEERRLGQGQSAQPSSAPQPGSRASNDPTAIATRRCLELGGTEIECLGKGLSGGFMSFLGLNLDAIKAPPHTGLIIDGQYRAANGLHLTFSETTVVLAGCGTLIDSTHNYTTTKNGNSISIRVANDPAPFALILGPDGNIIGPGPTDIQGQIITSYRNYIVYERRVSDNSIVSQHPASEPVLGPKRERCSIGAMRSTGPVASANLIPALTAATQPSKEKSTPAGPRMSGTYQGPGGLKIQFASEGAVLDCRDAHVARAYTVAVAPAAIRITIDNAGVPLVLALQPDGTLSGDGAAEVLGRVVSGTTADAVTFAPRRASCPIGVLTPASNAATQ